MHAPTANTAREHMPDMQLRSQAYGACMHAHMPRWERPEERTRTMSSCWRRFLNSGRARQPRQEGAVCIRPPRSGMLTPTSSCASSRGGHVLHTGEGKHLWEPCAVEAQPKQTAAW